LRAGRQRAAPQAQGASSATREPRTASLEDRPARTSHGKYAGEALHARDRLRRTPGLIAEGLVALPRIEVDLGGRRVADEGAGIGRSVTCQAHRFVAGGASLRPIAAADVDEREQALRLDAQLVGQV